METTDQIKYAKVLYLADELEDIQNEISADWSCRTYALRIKDIVEGLRETMAAANNIERGEIEIERVEDTHMVSLRELLLNPIFVKYHISAAEDGILRFIKDNKLIRVRQYKDEARNTMTFTASLIVCTKKQ